MTTRFPTMDDAVTHCVRVSEAQYAEMFATVPVDSPAWVPAGGIMLDGERVAVASSTALVHPVEAAGILTATLAWIVQPRWAVISAEAFTAQGAPDEEFPERGELARRAEGGDPTVGTVIFTIGSDGCRSRIVMSTPHVADDGSVAWDRYEVPLDDSGVTPIDGRMVEAVDRLVAAEAPHDGELRDFIPDMDPDSSTWPEAMLDEAVVVFGQLLTDQLGLPTFPFPR